MKKSSKLIDIFNVLKNYYGPRMWWPVTPPGKNYPEYTGGPENTEQRFEVAVGAVLTQNTSWKNAARAIENLNRSNNLNPEAIARLENRELANIIRPSGYYNMKARKLKVLADYFLKKIEISRESLLRLYGIGPETADSILLYAYDRPCFVIDAYTRRIFGRIGIIDADETYENIRKYFETNLPFDIGVFKEYHALIVEHAKSFCRKTPHCCDCPLEYICDLNDD